MVRPKVEPAKVIALKRTKRKPSKRNLDLELDRELEATFPASDPLKITREKPARTKISRRK